MMKKLINVSNIVIISVLLILSVGIIDYFQNNQAPTNPPLNLATISPQTKTSINITPTILPPTQTPSVLATSTASPSPTAPPTATPTIYISIGETKPITLPTPIVLPTATPTPTFEPLQGQAIGGYVFSTARAVPNVPNAHYELIEWLPDEPNKLLVTVRNMSVKVIDINTGETQTYSGDIDWVADPIWVPNQQAVAYMVDFETNLEADYLYIAKTNSDLDKLKPSFTTTVRSPLVTTPDGRNVILFDENWQLTQVSLTDTEAFQLSINTKIYKPPTYGHGDLYRVIQSPDRSKAFYYNDDNLLLVDFITSNLTEIDIESLKDEGMPPIKPIKDALWSPDGTKLALHSITSRYSAYWVIYNITTHSLSYLGDEVSTISYSTWAPDSRHFLSFTIANLLEGRYGLGTLLLFDTITKQSYGVAALPEVAIQRAIKLIKWSPDGKHIAVVFGETPETPALYVIDVQKP